MNKRQYKKAYWICKDDDGKMIYAGDTVELFIPYETTRSYTAVVHWDRLHGAMVKGHPAHRFLNNGKAGWRPLSGYLNQDKKGFPIYAEGGDETPTYRVGFCRKVKSFYENDLADNS